MKFGSVCSGIEAASVAWNPLGWEAAWFAEIDPFCCSLLAAKYPTVTNRGNINDFSHRAGEPPIDVLIGGTPCQSFSVTGFRKGMDDPRGQLTAQFVRLADSYRPAWIVWENVTGALSADGGRAFGAFVGALGNIGYGWAYRVLDCSQWGIAQRRRRLFVVASARGSLAAVAALFDEATLREHGCPIEAKQQDGVAADSCLVGWTGDETPKFGDDVCPTLRAMQGGEGVGVMTCMYARRLTVGEWEQLQGFPVDYTLVEHGGKLASDRVRIKAIGNSFPVPVVRWIGERIAFLDSLTE